MLKPLDRWMFHTEISKRAVCVQCALSVASYRVFTRGDRRGDRLV